MKVKIMTSARHVHLTKEDFNYLFGDCELTKSKDLNQTGQFASNEKVSIVTEKGRFDNVRIIGPLRNYTQVEISATDAYKLGINPPVRTSGDLENSENVYIEYNNKKIYKENCCIIADRHIHVSLKDSELLGLKNNQKVRLQVFGIKGGILDNVSIKVSDDGNLEAHLDVDDSNAHLIKNNDEGEIL